MGSLLFASLEEGFCTLGVLGHPLGGEFAGLDLAEDLAHRLAGVVGDDSLAARVIAVLGSVGDRVTHPAQTTLEEQVDDELELVEHLEVRGLFAIAGIYQGLDRCLDAL